MRLAVATARHRATRNCLLALLLAAACLATTAAARTSGFQTSRFMIDARTLSPALIQFSRQSGVAIVFSDRLTRNLPASPVIGNHPHAEAMDILLAGTGLSWELIDDRIIAVFRSNCGDPDCETSLETLSKHPVYEPNIEETYVYGSRLTGSRIRRTSYNRSAPVDVLAAPDIELSGAQTLGELLKFVPAVVGNSTSTAIANGGDGTATVTLRGLPASNTLILINGRRVANDGLAGESVDLNSIPPAAVERVEILKDGASAIYGSDAIAGVVNIIMKQDFHGFLAETYYGEAEVGDLTTTTHTLQYGTGFNRGSFFISGSQYKQDPIFSRDRGVSRNADTRAQGGTDQRSSATPNTRIVLPDGQSLIATNGDYRATTANDLFNYQHFTTAVVPLERNSIYSNVSYDFTDQIIGLLELSYLETEANATLAPTPVFTAFEQTPLVIAADNIYNPFAVEIRDARRRLLEFPERIQRNSAEVSRISASIEGLYADWNWDIGYGWSRNKASEVTTNLVNADHLRRGLGSPANCRGADIDGCTAINLLGPVGSLTPQQVDYISADGEVSGYSELSSIIFNVSNTALSLPSGRGDVAFGLEHREEATRKRPNRLLATTNTIGATNFEETEGDRQITEFYAETALPLWTNASGLSSLQLDAAVRYSNYSDFGNSTNPKLGLRLQLGPGVLLRASYAGGFRAPSLNELYEGNSEDQAFIDDPCRRPENVARLPGCLQQADPSRNQFLVVKGGNPELKPETADTISTGLVWTPRLVEGLKLSLDLFQIEQEDVVSSSAQFIVSRNASFGEFSENVTRDDRGNLVLVTANNINVGRRRVRGADMAVTYQFPLRDWGQFYLSGAGTYLHEYLQGSDTNAPEFDLVGSFRDEAAEGRGGIPEWKWLVGMRWSKERWRGSYDIHYISGMRELLPDSDQIRNIASWTVHDLQLSYTFNILDGLRWSLGIDNAFSQEAPLAASAFNDNIDGRSHELKGRYWYTKLSQRF